MRVSLTESGSSRRLKVLLVETGASDRSGSMRRYAELLLHALEGVKPSRHLEVKRINLALPAQFLESLPSSLQSLVHHAWIALRGGVIRLRARRFDLIHLLDGSHGYVARLLKGGAPVIVTVHDLIPLLQKRGFLDEVSCSVLGRHYSLLTIKGLECAHRIVTDSENTRSDLIRLTDVHPTRSRVVNLPIASELERMACSGRSSAPGHEHAYVLHVGGAAFYKNRLGVVRIFAAIRSQCEVRLKMVGPAPDLDLLRLVRELNLEREVSFIDQASDRHLWRLYRQAALLLFPSLYEGFGWPPLEAMACGCPVVCSSAGSLPEVVGRAAMTSAVGDESQLAAMSVSILKNPELARELAKRGYKQASKFTSERMVEQLLTIYFDVANNSMTSRDRVLFHRGPKNPTPGIVTEGMEGTIHAHPG